jgi:ABC-type amino acid transport substrate-binding protein
MELKKRYLQKNGMVLMNIAREMMTLSPGDRMTTISEYVERFDVAKGTVQGILKYLCESAMSLDKMGHLGSYVKTIDYAAMWKFTGWEAIVGLLPLPLNARLRSLSTAITKAFESAHIPFRMAFMQSASHRIAALKEFRFDFIIVSELSSEMLLAEDAGLRVALKLAEDSYSEANRIAFRDPKETKIQNGMKVAFDPASPDQRIITEYITRGKTVKYVEMPYRSTLQSLSAGKVDAIVYQAETLKNTDSSFGLVEIGDQELARKVMGAVVAVNDENYHVGALLRKVISVDFVRRAQAEIEAGRILSYY